MGETHLFQYLMERRKSPFGVRAGRRVPLGPFHHAYHFDQAQVGAFLRRQAAGVTVIDDQVTAVAPRRRDRRHHRPRASKAAARSPATSSSTAPASAAG